MLGHKFVCQFCGIVSDNPEIVPCPDSKDDRASPIRYKYSITCPVCLNETCFWRDDRFPIDKLEGVRK